MKGKKQYYKLDDIGIVGVQSGRSKAQIKQDMERTSQYFKRSTQPVKGATVVGRTKKRKTING